MGAIMSVVLARVFMQSYPVLQVNSFNHPHPAGGEKWQSAMTYKFVWGVARVAASKAICDEGAVDWDRRGSGDRGVAEIDSDECGLSSNLRQDRMGGKVSDFVLDAIVLPSPYASSFGGFVELGAALWFGAGGVIRNLLEGFFKWSDRNKPRPAEGEVPSDMSTTSLVGGGLIAGDSLAALAIGISGLLKTLF